MRSNRRHEWRERRLGECGQWLSGGTPSKSNPEYWGGDVPWVGPKDLHIRYVDDAEEHLTSLGVSNGTRIVPENTVLLVVRSMALAQRLQISLTRRQVAFNQDIKAILPDADIDPRFLFYALWGHHDALHALVDEASHGTKRLRTDVLADYQLAVPSLDEQKRITRVLAALDDKIDSNRRLAALLEETAAAIFKARFVDLVGVDESNVIERPLRDVTLMILRGRAPSYCHKGGTLVVNQRCVRDGKIDFDKARRHDSVERPVSQERMLRVDDLLVNSTGVGTLGRIAPVRWLPEPATVDGHVTIVRPDPDALAPGYLTWELATRQAEIERLAEGSTGQTELSRSRLAEVAVRVPGRSAQDEFARVVRPAMAQIATCEREVSTLATLRDLLLPKLISGEIRVPDTTDPNEVIGLTAEQLVEAAR